MLPDALANQIAAGEVVQRPASVVKELLENSIDAGARHVQLNIRQAGKSFIQVIDDGSGMSEIDARMAFERHATSKIRRVEDLFQVLTYGFRGEALASIAAVSQVALKTQPEGQPTGFLLRYEGGHLKTQEPAASAQQGTTITVKNLFFNVPARRNFLKSNTVEGRHITDEFIRVALSYPQVAFVMRNEGDIMYQLPSGTLRQRVRAVFGKKYEGALVPVSEKTSILNIAGFVGKPELGRKSRGEQYFFVNQRYVRHPYLHHAVREAFGELLSSEHHPFYLLSFELAPERVDINVHPTKTEVKFDDERAIYAMLSASIRRALSQHQVAPSLDFEQQDWHNPAAPWQQGSPRSARPDATPTEGRPPDTAGRASGSGAESQRARPGEWEQLYDILKQDTPEAPSTGPATLRFPSSASGGDHSEAPASKVPQQLLRKFILAPIKTGLLVVNQYRAHQRILYEEFARHMQSGQTPRQQQLFPQEVDVSGADTPFMEHLHQKLTQLGFELEAHPDTRSLRFTGWPLHTAQLDLRAFVGDLLDHMHQHGSAPASMGDDVLLQAMARNAAVKSGQVLSPPEMQHMIDRLFACQDPYFTPSGKTTLITLAGDELEQRFG